MSAALPEELGRVPVDILAGAVDSLAANAHAAGVEQERARIAAMLRRRGDQALNIAARNGDRLNGAEAARLKRWLDSAAQDVEQGLD